MGGVILFSSPPRAQQSIIIATCGHQECLSESKLTSLMYENVALARRGSIHSKFLRAAFILALHAILLI